MNVNHKKTVIDIITILCIKKLSNLFWELADTYSYKSNKIAQHYNKSIEKEYKKEYATYDLKSESNVLHIGAGSYPLTVIVLAQCCLGTFVGIDNNPVSVQHAQEVIRQRQLQNRITIRHGDGTEFPVNNFDFIIVSSCSEYKPEILDHLFKNAKHQTTIIVRELSIATADVLHSINSHPEIEIIQRMYHAPFPYYGPLAWDTFYLRKI